MVLHPTMFTLPFLKIIIVPSFNFKNKPANLSGLNFEMGIISLILIRFISQFRLKLAVMLSILSEISLVSYVKYSLEKKNMKFKYRDMILFLLH